MPGGGWRGLDHLEIRLNSASVEVDVEVEAELGKILDLVRKGGGHSGLLCDTSSKRVCLYLMPHYGRGCRISTLIMVPINFWRNSDLFKKKEHFSSSKIDNFRAFQRKSLKIFKENLSNTKQKSLKPFWSYFDDFEYQIE